MPLKKPLKGILKALKSSQFLRRYLTYTHELIECTRLELGGAHDTMKPRNLEVIFRGVNQQVLGAKPPKSARSAYQEPSILNIVIIVTHSYFRHMHLHLPIYFRYRHKSWPCKGVLNVCVSWVVRVNIEYNVMNTCSHKT